MPEDLRNWNDVEEFVTRVRSTDVYRQYISNVRHPLGILMGIISREIDLKEKSHERDDTWAPDIVLSTAAHIRFLIYGSSKEDAAPATHGLRHKFWMTFGNKTAPT